MIGKIFGAFEQIGEYFNSRPARLKSKALEAAEYFMEIDTYQTYKGEFVGLVESVKLKKHFRKQFNSWRDGV